MNPPCCGNYLEKKSQTFVSPPNNSKIATWLTIKRRSAFVVSRKTKEVKCKS